MLREEVSLFFRDIAPCRVHLLWLALCPVTYQQHQLDSGVNEGSTLNWDGHVRRRGRDQVEEEGEGGGFDQIHCLHVEKL